MAVRGRNAKPDLSELEARSMDFFELLRRFETSRRRFGRGGTAESEPARLGQSIRLAFAASDVVSVTPADDPEGAPHIAVNVIGLFGPEGPMPLHLTRWMLERASNRWFAGDDENATSDKAFLDFGNMLQHRMIAFYWRAWADMRPEVQIQHGTGGSVSAMIRALAGIGLTPPSGANPSRSSAKLRHATSLFQRVQGPERLTEYLTSVSGYQVALREFVGVWTPLPEHLQSRLGLKSVRLGRDAVVGARFYERQSRAEIQIGPLDLKEYVGFLDETERAQEIHHALLFAMGHGIEFDLRLVLKAEDVPEPRLASMRLGRLAWLGRPKHGEADDLVYRRFVSAGQSRDWAA